MRGWQFAKCCMRGGYIQPGYCSRLHPLWGRKVFGQRVCNIRTGVPGLPCWIILCTGQHIVNSLFGRILQCGISCIVHTVPCWNIFVCRLGLVLGNLCFLSCWIILPPRKCYSCFVHDWFHLSREWFECCSQLSTGRHCSFRWFDGVCRWLLAGYLCPHFIRLCAVSHRTYLPYGGTVLSSNLQ